VTHLRLSLFQLALQSADAPIKDGCQFFLLAIAVVLLGAEAICSSRCFFFFLG